MIIHLHNLHFYNVYMYHSEDNIILITRGISFCRRDKHDQYTLYNQYYYLLLSGKLSFCTLSRNQFTPNLCIIEVTSIELYAKFSQTTPSYSDIFATDQCNLSTFHSPLNSFRARVKEHYDRLIIIGQDKQAKVLKIFRVNCAMAFGIIVLLKHL